MFLLTSAIELASSCQFHLWGVKECGNVFLQKNGDIFHSPDVVY